MVFVKMKGLEIERVKKDVLLVKCKTEYYRWLGLRLKQVK